MKPVFDFIARYVDLTDAERDFVISTNRIRTCKKNEIVMKSGPQATEAYFVLSGSVYSLYAAQDEQIVGDFFFEGTPVIIPPYFGGLKSEYELRCMEDSTLAVSSLEQAENNLSKFPRFERVCRLFAEEKLAETIRFHDQLKGKSPLEKYRYVLKERAELVRRAPQYLLANYLGMAPETLSRVRGQMASVDLDSDQ